MWQDNETEDKRNIILQAALQVFSAKGFHPATVDEIARRAGVGKGTVYEYFPSKEALFHNVIQSGIDFYMEALLMELDGGGVVDGEVSGYGGGPADGGGAGYDGKVAEPGGPGYDGRPVEPGDPVYNGGPAKPGGPVYQQIRRLYRRHLQLVSTQGELKQIFSNELGKITGDLKKWMREKHKQLVDRLQQVIQRGIDSGELAQVHPRVAAHLVVSGMRVVHMYLPEANETLDQVIEEELRILWKGMSS